MSLWKQRKASEPGSVTVHRRGGKRIRTSEGVRRRFYRPLPLATRASRRVPPQPRSQRSLREGTMQQDKPLWGRLVAALGVSARRPGGFQELPESGVRVQQLSLQRSLTRHNAHLGHDPKLQTVCR
jgi:hypothetical protein